ncbi:transcriptional regulator [Enterococcus villorum]|uniref:Transcriptional regulator n=3 Tax=Enterococcus villorum TaxID=112904 RepID=A0A511J0W5_9ENTE|nr:transcriptional activator Rgg/GadR/MutR [Enterococcus villorum ATCC 700913]EOW76246.1 transcriptional activator Rgg/GadR/MutR [Enterococcus villorum ATCC 700913]GEL91299.1 transcriptional regulator [Enterococcus villorum]
MDSTFYSFDNEKIMYDGKLIKQLRINRKLTQTQLAAGICSKTSLVAIENHSVKKISFFTLKAFLERLNISLAEYEWLRNQIEEPKKAKKSRHLLNKIEEENFDPYKEIANNRKQFKKTSDLYYLILNLQMFWKTSEKLELQLEFLRYECRTIEEYFMQVREYGRFELEILSRYPYIFSDSFIDNNYLKIKKRMRQMSDAFKEKYLFTFLINLTLYYIDKKRFKKARSINMDMYRSLAHKEKSTIIYETLMTEYYKRLIAQALGEPMQEETNTLFTVIEYTLGKKERKVLEEKLLEVAKVKE